MQTIRDLARRVRFLAAVVGLMAAVVCAPPAFAGSLTLSLHIDGVSGQDGKGNWNDLASYTWGVPGLPLPGASPLLTFFHDPTDGTTTALMTAVANHQKADTAELQVICKGTATTVTLDYLMVNVHFESLGQQGVNSAFTNYSLPLPIVALESVALAFNELDYTYQGVNPVCQPAGAPQTFTWTFR